MDTPTLPHDYDGYWKFALDRYLSQLVLLAAPDAAGVIDWSSPVEALDKVFLPHADIGDEGHRFVDTLVRVRMRGGEHAVLLMHVEIQSDRDDAFAARMFAYWVRIHERYAQPVCSIAVLADDDPGWRPSSFGVAAFGTRMHFEYATLKLTDFEPQLDLFLGSDDPLLVLIAVDRVARRTRHDTDRSLSEKTRLARTLLRNPKLERRDVLVLIRLLTRLMVLPQNLERRFIDEVRRTEGRMAEDYGFLNTLTPWETIALEKGIEKGRVAELRALILRAAQARFSLNEIDSQGLRASLELQADEHRLELLFDAAVLAASRSDFDARLRALAGGGPRED